MSDITAKGTAPHRVVLAENLKVGMWLTYNRPGREERIVDIDVTRDGQVKLHTDYGNGGEPATQFYEKTDRVRVVS